MANTKKYTDEELLIQELEAQANDYKQYGAYKDWDWTIDELKKVGNPIVKAIKGEN